MTLKYGCTLVPDQVLQMTLKNTEEVAEVDYLIFQNKLDTIMF